MALKRYDVEYEDGRKRVKQLNDEDADRLAGQNGVKNVKPQKQRARAQDKQRGRAADKAAGGDE